MQFTKKQNFLFLLLLFTMFFLFLVNISLGSVAIPLKEVIKGLLSQEMSKENWEIILWNFRFPKAITAVLVGIGLSMSGLLMQTLFRNPLAGPYVLGLSSGASLGVAFIILGTAFLPPFISSFFLSNYGLVLASSLGSFSVLMAVLLVKRHHGNSNCRIDVWEFY
jgi:iron complex transport system permease protein